MQIRKMVATDAGTVRRYTLSLNLTPEEDMPKMSTQAEIQHGLIMRAEALAMREGYQGPGKFTPKHYQLALAERSPSERGVERGFASIPPREPSQQQRASRHLAERVRYFAQEGHTRADAVAMASKEHLRSGLGQISLPRNSPWDAAGERTQRNEVHRFAKLNSTGVYPTTHGEAALTGADLLPMKVAASVLARGGNTPNQIEIAWVSDWWGTNQPAPRPTPQADPRILDKYNKARLRFVEDVCKEVTAIFRDPVKRNQIAPAKLW